MCDSKKIVYSYVKTATKHFIENSTVFNENTQVIAEKCHLSRSVVSKYLNSLFKNHLLIKISTRPVIYLDRGLLEDEYGYTFSTYEFLSIEEFLKDIDKKHKDDFFKDVIGKADTLKEILFDAATIKNNQKSQLILLSGEQGTGKSYLAKLIGEYLCDRTVKPVTLTCTEGHHDYLKLLFDSKEGIYKDAHQKLLIFENFDIIDSETQKRIIFRVKNILNHEKDSPNYFIITTASIKKIESSILDEIDYSFHLVPLSARPVEEKEEFILKRIRRNEANFNKKIYISNLVFYSLTYFHYPFNITSLNQTIDQLVLRADNEQRDEDKICIYQYHLPIWLIEKLDLTRSNESKELLDTEQIKQKILNDRLTSLCEEIKQSYLAINKLQSNKEIFMKDAQTKIVLYCDYIVFEKKANSSNISIIENVIKTILVMIENKYKFIISPGISNMLSRFLYENTYVNTKISHWQTQNNDFIIQFNQFLNKSEPMAYMIVCDIEQRIAGVLEMKMDMITKLYLIFSLTDIASSLENINKLGLVIAHGYSTATSIAESVNRLIGKNVIKGIDMPIDTKTSEIIIKIRNYILSKSISKSIILLVDMGSLEQIATEISKFTSKSVGIINNISTRTVLSVGYGILNDLSVEQILDKAQEASQSITHIIGNEEKAKAIIFTFDSGMKSSEKTMQIFKTSMPRQVDIKFIAVDYVDLSNAEKQKEITQNYDVLFIVGTYVTNAHIAPFIALEELVSMDNINKLSTLFRNELTKDEIIELNTNILKNFSLENIMQNLTILNPTTLIDYIDKALLQLQRELGVRFNNKVLAGLYIHISCMVERLVTKMAVIFHDGLDQFEMKNKDFIDIFKSCFQDLMRHYNIIIPLSEIAYLYDYIENGFIYIQLNEQKGENIE